MSAALAIDHATRRVNLNPRDRRFYADPYPAYAAIRAAIGGIFHWVEQDRWCFLDAADIAAVLKDGRFGREPIAGVGAQPWERLPAVRAFHRHSLLELEPPGHSRLRGLVSGAFLGRAIERSRTEILAMADGLIDGFKARGRVELIEAFATPIPVAVIMRLLGVPAEAAPDVLAWSHRMVAIYELGRTAAIEDAAETATAEFTEFLRGHIRPRRREPADDLISHLIAAEAAGDRLNEDELIATCILLLNAGHEATVHAIGNSVKTLLESSHDPAALFLTPESTAAAVEECLRFDPPLHLFTRYIREDLEWAGIPLRRGEQIALLYGAANRDPARFPEPDRFDPQRGGRAHFSFGGGIHFCLGAPLARLELQIALPLLFRRLPRLRLASTPEYRDQYHFHGLTGLHLAWD